MTNSKTPIRVALDWTPNTIHSGLFLAHAKNLYSDAGLDVQLLPPDPSYSTTPAKRLEAGEADLAICPSESIIAYAESAKPNFQLQAIYAILKQDASAIVTKADEILRPRDLEDGVYGSYGARYEDAIVREMVNIGGGDGSKVRMESSKGKLSLFEELKKGTIDATWIFLPWEGVEAQLEALALNVFRMEDAGIPYGYSPVIARNAASEKLSDDVLGRVVQATRRGYEMARTDAATTVQVMKEQCPGKSTDFLEMSQSDINGFYGENDEAGELGTMRLERWQGWIDWLKEKRLVMKEDLRVEELFTNRFFE
ncbi:hypothetical protein PMZ80_010956 [Knufia obscura]|uniref:4-amino-5-hydroxymethyl-2-methylpyrimidine phosphate synthase n=1 Tax=Knufia obscura TaxID=1635080 RepID=A0ABR0R879_9EURO|nr:hypothetical protein PMZ80_010956 [Knufia obscura]